jgi:hypothetical protein
MTWVPMTIHATQILEEKPNFKANIGPKKVPYCKPQKEKQDIKLEYTHRAPNLQKR